MAQLAIILEQRADDDAKLEAFGPIILDFMRDAAELAEKSDCRRSSHRECCST